MKEPRRWIGVGNSLEGRLLRAALEEPVPRDALGRAAQRLGVSAAVLGSVKTGLACAAVVETTAGTVAAANASVTPVGLLLFAKGVGVGFIAGAVAIGSAHVVLAPALSTSAAASSHTVKVTPQVTRGSTVGRSNVTSEVATLSSEVVPSSVMDVPKPSAQKSVGSNEPVSSTPQVVTTGLSNGWLPPPVSASELRREVRILDQARTALKSKDAARTLTILDEAELTQPLQALTQEAHLIRVEALGALGRTTEAGDLAAELLKQGVSAPQRAMLSRWVR